MLQLMAQGGDVARSWIEGLTDDSLRDVAMKISADYLAPEDPAGIAKWLVEHPGEASQKRMDDVYGKWARVDQQAALASVDALPAGSDRSNALNGVVCAMATSDPATALAQIESRPDWRHETTLKSWLGSDSAAAKAWIQQISCPSPFLTNFQANWAVNLSPSARSTRWVIQDPQGMPWVFSRVHGDIE